MLYLAIRHLLVRRKQSLFTLLGVLLASLSFVVISGFFLGFQEFLIDQLLNNDAHIKISAKEEFIEPRAFDQDFFGKVEHVFWISPPGGKNDNSKILNPQGWYRLLESDPRVVAYSPQMTAQVFISRAATSIGGRLIGSDPARQSRVTNIQAYMLVGKFNDIAGGGNRAILGDEYLKSLGARVGETVLITNGRGAPTPFKVVGSFHTGIRTLDLGVAFAALQDVQKINNTPSQVNEIAVRVINVDHAREIAEQWTHVSVENVKSWDQINANILNVFNIQNATRYMMVFVIILVAGFGVYNILNMVVNQKRREIAILRSMGYEQNDVVFLFLSQGLILGFLGGLVGLIAGYFVCLFLQTIPFGGGPMGGGSGRLTISFSLSIYIFGMLLSVVSASLASFIPARAAGKMTPIDIIRGGAE